MIEIIINKIFIQTFDGIDRDKYVVATYYMDDTLPGEDFIDHFALIQSMALATDQENRMRQDLQLANQIAVAPSLAIGGNAIQQQQLIDAQQSDPLLQALGVAAGAASNAFAPGSGGAASAAVNSLTGARAAQDNFGFDFGFGPQGPTVR